MTLKIMICHNIYKQTIKKENNKVEAKTTIS